MKTKRSSQLTSRRYSPLGDWRIIVPVLLWLAGMIVPASVLAARPNPSPDSIHKDVRYVDCGSSNKLINSINAALASLDPSEDNTIYVHGACSENVNITGFDRLKLIAQNGASISDASGGVTPVVSITDSLRVSLQGFTINGSGPSDQTDGLDCIASSCSFSGNTFQGAGDSVNVVRGAHASFNGDIFQDNSGDGLFIGQNAFVLATGVIAQRNGEGVRVTAASTLLIINSKVQYNGGAGISVVLNSTASTRRTSITGNAGEGIRLNAHSTLLVGGFGDVIGNSITANQGVGILVKDLSFASFLSGVPNVVKNNLGGTDVLCSPQFPATRGALTDTGGGTTNCVEP
jgi:hypothetical protein